MKKAKKAPKDLFDVTPGDFEGFDNTTKDGKAEPLEEPQGDLFAPTGGANLRKQDLKLPAGFDAAGGFEAPRPSKTYFNAKLSYSRAVEAVEGIDFYTGMEFHTFLTGLFRFGDFLEALIARKQWKVRQMSVSTLGMNSENIANIANILETGLVDRFVLHIANMHWARDPGLVEKLLHKLGRNPRFQIVVARNHCKVALFDIEAVGASPAAKLAIYGSANMRSSDCLENIVIRESAEVYAFYSQVFDVLEAEYHIKSSNAGQHSPLGKPATWAAARPKNTKTTTKTTK